VIDLHSHILPGLDDGPADIHGSLAFARKAVEAGTTTIVATPHVRDDHPFPLELIDDRAHELTGALADAGVPLEVATGAEVALSKLPDLDDSTLEGLCLGSGRYLLVESPYTYAPELLENMLFSVQARGFRPILAHPERSPSFLSDQVRLTRLVDRGILCSITAMSMTGAFGDTVRRFSVRLFARGVVHNVASDAHDETHRQPGLTEGFERLDQELPGLADQTGWFTRDAARAILAGDDLPPRPATVMPAERGLRRLLGRKHKLARQLG
jgi:protein-tyrosine phosphatase